MIPGVRIGVGSVLVAALVGLNGASARADGRCRGGSWDDLALDAGQLRFRVVEPPGAGPETPVVLAIHGLGDSARGFEGLARRLRLPWRVVLPDGPMRWSGGFSWYRIGCGHEAEDVRRSAALLDALLDRVRARWPRAPKPVVLGFSQGGVMSFALAALSPQRIRAAVPMSGALPLGFGAVPAAPAAAPPLLVVHGRVDTVIAFSRAQEAASAFHAAGWSVRLVEHAFGHTVPDPALREAAGWLRSRPR